MEIYITGDLHGDLRRFQPGIFYEQESLTKEDIILVCGDFGCVWHGDERDDEGLDWLEGRPFTTAFVTGNHENYDALRKYPLAEWRGGSIRRIRPSVILLERGQIFDLGGKRFFTIGGASSHDIQDGILEPDDSLFKKKCRELDARGAMYRINHLSWWKEELPSETEYQTAKASLDRAGWEVDYIITHCCPSSVQDIFSGGLYQKDALTEFFDEIRQRCQFKYWFFGHYHEDMVIEKKYSVPVRMTLFSNFGSTKGLMSFSVPHRADPYSSSRRNFLAFLLFT